MELISLPSTAGRGHMSASATFWSQISPEKVNQNGHGNSKQPLAPELQAILDQVNSEDTGAIINGPYDNTLRGYRSSMQRCSNAPIQKSDDPEFALAEG